MMETWKESVQVWATRRAGRPYYANRRVLRAQADCPLDQVEIHELTRMFVAQGHDVKV